MKNIRVILSEILPVMVVKFSIYLNRRVFVMRETDIPASVPMESISDRYRFKESDRSKNANWEPRSVYAFTQSDQGL